MADAETSRIVTLKDLPHDFSLTYLKDVSVSLKSKQQGFKYFAEGYIERVRMTKDRKSQLQVSARCYRSQRKNEQPHLLHLDIVPGRISLSNCSCVAGASGCCSHIVGLILALQNWQLMGLSDIPSELSSTSLPQQWSIPRGPKIVPRAVPQITILQPKPDRKQMPLQNKVTDCRNRRVTKEDIENLKECTDLPISYLVTQPKKTVQTMFGEVPIGSGLSTQAQFYEDKTEKEVTVDCGELVMPQIPPLSLPENFKPLPDDIKISQERAEEIERNTRQQSDCKLWVQERRKRLTASKFNEIVKRRTINEKYLDRLFSTKSLNVSATQYGINKESTAKQKYIGKTGRHVHDCGLVINPEFPFLGATPDARVCDQGSTGILEIKCPYSARNMDVNEAIETLTDFFLERDENGMRLKKNHAHFCQVQGQLMVTGAPFCDFVVLTSKDLYIERIFPDHVFMKDLNDKLCEIYFNYVRDYLQKA